MFNSLVVGGPTIVQWGVGENPVSCYSKMLRNLFEKGKKANLLNDTMKEVFSVILPLVAVNLKRI